MLHPWHNDQQMTSYMSWTKAAIYPAAFSMPSGMISGALSTVVLVRIHKCLAIKGWHRLQYVILSQVAKFLISPLFRLPCDAQKDSRCKSNGKSQA